MTRLSEPLQFVPNHETPNNERTWKWVPRKEDAEPTDTAP